MRRCVIYARYSSEKQTEQSIEGQLRVCYEYAQRNDLIVVKEYIDRAMTGTNDLRRDFQKMLSDSEKTKEWDICLVYALDRFGRNAVEQGINKYRLQKTGKIVISATQRTSRNIDGSQNLDGIILENVYIGMAEYYSAELSQKVKRGFEVSRNKGHFTGGKILFGYKSIGTKASGFKIVPDECESDIVRKIFEDYTSGKQVMTILDDLKAQGVLHNGKFFKKSTLYNMLKNEKYIGKTIIKGKIYDNIYPQIIQKNVFDIAKEKIDNNKYGKHTNENVFLLRFKIKCGYCGNSVGSDTGTSGNGSVIRYYKCAGRKIYKNCDNVPIKKEVLENIVLDTINKVMKTPKIIEYLAEKIMEAHKKRVAEDSMQKYLEENLRDTEKAISNLISCMEQGIVSNSTKQRLLELEERKEKLQNDLISEKIKNKIEVSQKSIIEYMRSAISKKPQLMIDLLIKEIKLFKNKIEIYFNYSDKTRPDDDSRRVFIFYKKEDVIYIDKHLFCCDAEPFKYNLEFYI